MEIDDALRRAGPLGRTQIVVLTVSGLMAIEVSWLILSVVFIAEAPPHHCTLCSNCSIEQTIPVDSEGVYSQCEEYVDPRYGNDTQECSDQWQYDSELYGESIVTEWDLVCNLDSLAGLSQSIFLLGFGIGAIFSGAIADKYGRRPISIISLLVFNMLGVSVSFSPNYITFVILRFFVGIVFRGVHLPTMITMFEYLIPEYRPTVGNMPPLFFSLGLMLMSGIAYLVRDWRFFHLTLMGPTILTMGLIWFQPESVRWLTSIGRHSEAEERMQRVANFNKAKDFPSPALKAPDECKEELTDLDKERIDSVTEDKGSLFKPPTLIVTLITGWLWIAFTLIYFGFALSTGTLAGDPYVNFFLSSLVEVPARIIPLFILKRFGNLIPLIVFFTSTGICMIVIIVTPFDAGNGWVITSFALLGKFLAVCIFSPLNLLNVELYPTTLRTAGTGFTQLVGNIGSVSSPILLYLDRFVPKLSFMIMTASAFLSALLCLLLPETRGAVQPETPADLQELFHSKSLLSCHRKASRTSSDVDIVDGRDIVDGIDNAGFLEDEL